MDGLKSRQTLRPQKCPDGHTEELADLGTLDES